MDASVYKRPNKPKTMPVTRRRDIPLVKPIEVKEPVIVDRATECHVTPPEIADLMVECVNDYPGAIFLEPQAGTGNLIDALIRAGVDPSNITAVERHIGLANIVSDRFPGVAVINSCFLEFAQSDRTFGRIIMNPPFRSVKKHMAAALGCLEPGGTLVALVPVTYHHDSMYEVTQLGPDTFAACRVNTKIIEITNE